MVTQQPLATLPQPAVIRAFDGAVPAGFPSPSQDYQTSEIDLNKHLGLRKTSCYLMRVTGHSMTLAGICDGDEIIVDRAIRPRDGHIVVAVIDGELTVKRLRIAPDGGVFLTPEHPDYPVIEIPELSDFTIWGVVTRCLHYVR